MVTRSWSTSPSQLFCSAAPSRPAGRSRCCQGGRRRRGAASTGRSGCRRARGCSRRPGPRRRRRVDVQAALALAARDGHLPRDNPGRALHFASPRPARPQSHPRRRQHPAAQHRQAPPSASLPADRYPRAPDHCRSCPARRPGAPRALYGPRRPHPLHSGGGGRAAASSGRIAGAAPQPGHGPDGGVQQLRDAPG